MLEKEASSNIETIKYKDRPLIRLILNNNIEGVKLLLEKIDNLNFKGAKDDTAFIEAVSKDNMEIAFLPFNKDAKP